MLYFLKFTHPKSSFVTKQQSISKAITEFIKEANKQGQHSIISAGLNEAIFQCFNQPKNCLTSENLERLRSVLNNWREQNEELSKAFNIKASRISYLPTMSHPFFKVQISVLVASF